ncbi:MAG: NAD(P)H-dependent oxidoreductase [Propionibacteriaceae bacterium]
MTLFRLDASIREDGSASREIADIVVDEWLAVHPDDAIERRHIGIDVLPADAWSRAVGASYVPEAERSPEQRSAVELAAALVDELLAADAVVLAVPLYNFGVSQHFKTWFDIVGTDPRFAPGSTTLAGKPAFLVTARGGGYGAGTPREGWDHATGWMRRVLADVWGLDLDVIETELTLAEVNPAMAELRDLAREQLAESHEAARHSARSVTIKLAPAA